MSASDKVFPQIGHDGPWAPFDCWVASTRGLVAFASNGKVKIDPQTVRQRANHYVANPTQADLERLGPGNLPDIKRVLTHADTVADFAKAGLKPPKVRDLEITKATTVFAYLAKGYQAAVAINYGALRALRPSVTGDPGFSGNHSVRWFGWYGTDGKPATSAPYLSDQLDPLDDGRRPGIAKGAQRLNRRILLAETAAVELHDANGNVVSHVGTGRVLALVVKPAEPISSGPVDPTPTDDPCADCESQLAAEQAEVDRLQGVIRAGLAALQDTGVALSTAAAILGDPANAGSVE